MMELFTEKEAIELIFEKNKHLSHFRVYKARYKRGKMRPDTISKLLTKFKFISYQIALYKIGQPGISIQIELEPKLFDQIFRYRITSIEIDKKKYEYLISQKLQFVRFSYKKWYMDITIRKIIIEDTILIHLAKIIDYNKPKQ
jgi:hypothetical protein